MKQTTWKEKLEYPIRHGEMSINCIIIHNWNVAIGRPLNNNACGLSMLYVMCSSFCFDGYTYQLTTMTIKHRQSNCAWFPIEPIYIWIEPIYIWTDCLHGELACQGEAKQLYSSFNHFLVSIKTKQQQKELWIIFS